MSFNVEKIRLPGCAWGMDKQEDNREEGNSVTTALSEVTAVSTCAWLVPRIEAPSFLNGGDNPFGNFNSFSSNVFVASATEKLVSVLYFVGKKEGRAVVPAVARHRTLNRNTVLRFRCGFF